MNKKSWQKPQVSTVDCRPEVTAYSGDLGRPLVVSSRVVSGVVSSR